MLLSHISLIKENTSNFSLFVSKIATHLSGTRSSEWTLVFQITIGLSNNKPTRPFRFPSQPKERGRNMRRRGKQREMRTMNESIKMVGELLVNF